MQSNFVSIKSFAMNQMKYILSACLILLMVFMGIFLYKTFSESGIVAKSSTVIDYSPAQKEVAIQPQELSVIEKEGKILFQKNCEVCHAVDKTDNNLLGFENRGPWKDRRELYKWIRKPKDYMLHDETGYTPRLLAVYGVQMLPSAHLSNADIDKILGYLARENK